MLFLQKLFQSSIGRKTLLAVTGIALGLFLIAHMSGNLLMFAGPNAINEYAVALRKLLKLGGISFGVWGARIGLLVFFGVHIILALRLSWENRRARPVRYKSPDTVQASMASRSMILTGMLVLAFLVYHLLHFTFGAINPDHFNRLDGARQHDVYRMVILGFSEPAILGSYFIAMLLLAMHLIHGISSLFQSMGWAEKNSYGFLKKISYVFVILIISGFLSVPVGIMMGVIK